MTGREIRRRLRRAILHPLEGLGFALALGLLRLLPVDWASGLCGAIARAIGPRLPVSEQARHNLRRALPTLDETRIESVVRGVWDNLGRVVGEYPHLRAIARTRIEVVGIEHLDVLRPDRPAIFFSAHFGNWELLPGVTARHGVALSNVYRAPNNRHVDSVLRTLRSESAELIPKGPAGARQLLQSMARNARLGMLVDQKMNDGIAIPFFGRDAMTAPALAQLALRYGCPVIPGHIERLGGAHFRLKVEPPLVLPDSGDRHADMRSLMTMVNRQLERWIAERPEQWLWLHRRWPD